jgi:hypothetical protein
LDYDISESWRVLEKAGSSNGITTEEDLSSQGLLDLYDSPFVEMPLRQGLLGQLLQYYYSLLKSYSL